MMFEKNQSPRARAQKIVLNAQRESIGVTHGQRGLVLMALSTPDTRLVQLIKETSLPSGFVTHADLLGPAFALCRVKVAGPYIQEKI